MRPGRQGMILPIALIVLGILVVMSFAVFIMSRQSYRGLSLMDKHLTGLAIGEAGHDVLIGRLKQAPWQQRWFAGGTDSGSGTWKDGTYEYLIADRPATVQADLVIWAHYQDTAVTLYWLIAPAPEDLSPYREVKTQMFYFLDPALQVSAGNLQTLRAWVEAKRQERESNAAWLEATEVQLMQLTNHQQIPAVMGVTSAPPMPTQIQGLGQGAPLPIGPQIQAQIALNPPTLPNLVQVVNQSNNPRPPDLFNPQKPWDTDGDGVVAPIDALLIINYWNSFGDTEVTQGAVPPPYLDVTGDNWIKQNDAQTVMNYLNSQ